MVVAAAALAVCVLIAGAFVIRRTTADSSHNASPSPAGSVAHPPPSQPSPSSSPSVPSPSPIAHHTHPEHEHEDYHPTGHLITAQGHDVEPGHSATITFIVQVEEGIKVDADSFARDVDDVLFDRRSWPGRFERVDHGEADFHVILASPGLTDQLCLPLQTAGIYSCFQGENAVLNSMRWKDGADAYGEDLHAYRIYMVNHEVGHALGHGHETCPAPGAKAPVMMQQTKGVAPCRPNPWP